jgi:hypothetical protein
MRLPRKHETRFHSVQQQKIEEKIERKRQQNMRKRRRERQETQETQAAAASVLQHKKKCRTEPHTLKRGKKKQLALVEKMKNPRTRLDDDKSPNLRLDDKSTYTTP